MKKVFLAFAFLALFSWSATAFAQTVGPELSATTGTGGTGINNFNGFSTSSSLNPDASQASGATYQAATNCNDTRFATFADIVGFVVCIINRFLIPLAIALALILFFWGVAQFVLNAGDTEERAQGKTYMIWGILALFILVSVWGILKFLSITLGFGASTIIPQFK